MKSLLRTRLGIITAALWIGLGAVIFGVGGDDPSRISLVGSVKVDGKPLNHGTICFFLVTEPSQPVSDGTTVHHGEFALLDSSTLVPGTYSVWINGIDEGAKPLPDRFNSKSVLDVVITHGGTCHLAFDLKL
jgi:hypothetical protein